MKMSTAKPKIVGVQLGEAAINYVRPGEPPITAKFLLLAEGGGAVCGHMTKGGNWSEKSLAALQALVDSLEEDALSHIFEVDSTKELGAPDSTSAEPPQF